MRGGQVGLEGGDDVAHEHGGGVLAAQHRPVILVRHLHALGVGVDAPGDDQGRDVLGQELLKADPPLLRRQAGQEGVLHPADDLEPVGIEVVEKAGELEPRAVHVLGADGPVFISGGRNIV